MFYDYNQRYGCLEYLIIDFLVAKDNSSNAHAITSKYVEVLIKGDIKTFCSQMYEIYIYNLGRSYVFHSKGRNHISCKWPFLHMFDWNCQCLQPME